MKSETQIKIIENRKRYFQELKKQIEDTNRAHQNESEALSTPQIVSEKKPKKPAPHKSVAKILLQGARATIHKLLLVKNTISDRLGSWSTLISERVSQRTEKTRGRVFSFLVVLFDAENS